ncbi:MAG TPA: membrane dipeptidase [Flavisolibacter sp.]|nr:membrane dipeptidase [Flavisolibacter sp.]
MKRFLKTFLGLIWGLTALAQDDAEGCKDPEGISRPQAYFIYECRKEEGEISLPMADNTIRSFEGRIHRYWFMAREKGAPPQPAQLAELIKASMRKAGFELVAEQKDADFGNMNHTSFRQKGGGRTIYIKLEIPYFNNGDQYYLILLETSSDGKIIWQGQQPEDVKEDNPEKADPVKEETPPVKEETPVKDTVPAPREEMKINRPAPQYTKSIRDTDFDNWGFEKGKLVDNPLQPGWKASGQAFRNQPTFGENVAAERQFPKMQYAAGGLGGDYWKDLTAPIGVRGSYWAGSMENRRNEAHPWGRTGSNADTGSLVSPVFTLTKPYMSFLMGGSAAGALQVQLFVKLTPEEQAGFKLKKEGDFGVMMIALNNQQNERMRRVIWKTDKWVGREMYVKIIDGSASGHINVDDFLFLDTDPTAKLLAVGNNLYDADMPVWGFADTHAHPTHQLGFGGNVMVGGTDGDLSVAMSNATCDQHHKGTSFGMFSGLWGNRNPFLKDFFGIGDWHMTDGYPDFAGFPKFNVKSHQQQHVSWIKRAYEGGLRLLCALGVNNTFIATRSFGPGNNGQALDDESVVYRELDYMKKVVNENASWMEIAYTPADARRIILGGKMAVVLGVEMDNFGNFKDQNYVWEDDRQRDKPLVALTPGNAKQLIDQKLADYYSYGIRQITSFHYINGVFGGTAIFRGEPQLAGWAFRNRTNVTSGVSRKVGFSLYEDFNAGAAFMGSAISYTSYSAHIHQHPAGSAEVSMVNADGLTAEGKILVQSMMKKGMLVDLEHMSYRSIDDLFSIASLYNYPILSSHTDPHENSFISNPLRRFNGSDEEKLRDFRTSSIRYIRHEGQLMDENMARIRKSGGTLGPIMLPYRKEAYKGNWGAVDNDCDGSSKTWAQMYLHCLDKMGGRGVGLSTDRGMTDFIGPRFGVNAAFALREEKLDVMKKQLRTTQRHKQKNGVRYDLPYKNYKPLLFENAEVEIWEEDAWKALALWSSGINPFAGGEPNIPASGEPGHGGRINAFTRGLFATSFAALRTCCGDTPFEEAAMFVLRKGPGFNYDRDLPAGFWLDRKTQIKDMAEKLAPIYQSWVDMSGNNEPLRRLRNGNRDWDFNLDGMAHYGMLPDFMQDLKNIGFTRRQLDPMFSSAEDYIRMWEKAEKAKAYVKD